MFGIKTAGNNTCIFSHILQAKYFRYIGSNGLQTKEIFSNFLRYSSEDELNYEINKSSINRQNISFYRNHFAIAMNMTQK